jgi:transcriptional regulator with XRE-family HTH domain
LERTFLYNIEPIGIGTPYVESLTSYIIRLADAHCVKTGTLISRIYAPYLQKDYLTKISIRGGGFFETANGINGVGKLAMEFSQLTNELTGRSDINETTLEQWSALLPNRGLLNKTKFWCPLCYEEARINEEVIYDQLIWNFQLVDTCMKHNTLLINSCVSCGSTILIIDRESAPGICSKCGSWLGSNSTLNRNTSESIVNTSLIGDLLAVSERNLPLGTALESLRFYMKEYFGHSKSKAASLLMVPKSTLNTWISGKSHPNIRYLVQICNVMGLSIIQFLQRATPAVESCSPKYNVSVKRTYDHLKIKNILDNAIEMKEPVSISEIARRIGCDRKLLSRKYKVECEEIKNNHSTYVEQNKNERLSRKIDQLIETFYLLLRQGIYPSRRQLESVLGTGFLKESALQEHWTQLKKGNEV